MGFRMGERDPRASIADRLVALATEIYEFGSIVTAPGTEPYEFAATKQGPGSRRPLAGVRDDLAADYALKYDKVPPRGPLADAMAVLSGLCRMSAPVTDSEAVAEFLSNLSGDKGSAATVIVNMAKELYTFGVTNTGDTFAVPVDGPNIARVMRGGRRSLRSELAKAYFDKHNVAPNGHALADALLVLEGQAQGSDPVEVVLRAGRAPDGQLVLDLGREDGAAVVVDAAGWRVVDRSPVLFWRTNATLPIPLPAAGGTLDGLRRLLNVSDEDWPLVVAWLVASLFPTIPHPVLLLTGEHGTAKSSAGRLLAGLVDRCASQLRTAPHNVEDWAVAAAGSWLTVLDNVSSLPGWLQDAICRASTGDGMLRRQLYTDSDVSVLAFRRVVAMTSIDPGKINGDLGDRLLTIELERISDERRTSEEDLDREWNACHADVLGALLDLTSQVLDVLPRIRHHTLPRLADFARIVLAVDSVLTTDAYTTFTTQATANAALNVETDNVARAITEHIEHPWQGTATALLNILTAGLGEHAPKDWPTAPGTLGGQLRRTAPVLRQLGWTVDYVRTGQRRRWFIAPPDTQSKADEPSRPSPPSRPVTSPCGHVATMTTDGARQPAFDDLDNVDDQVR